MADQVLFNPKVYVDEFDWSGDLMALALNYGVETHDDTKSRDSSAGDPATRIFHAGHKTVEAEAEGVVNVGADLSDEEAHDKVGVADSIITIAPGHSSGYATIDGLSAYSMRGLIRDLNRQAPVGEKFKFTYGFSVTSGSLKRGTIMLDASAAITSSGNGTARQLGALSATQKLWGALHVFERSAGDTLDVVIQSDTVGMPSPTSRITFAQVTDANSNNRQFSEVAGAITDDYWRVNYTLGGAGMSFRFVVVLGIYTFTP